MYKGAWVMVTKTQLIIFSRGKVRRHRKFTFGGENIEVVDEYIYLGVILTYNNKFTRAIQKQLT